MMFQMNKFKFSLNSKPMQGNEFLYFPIILSPKPIEVLSLSR